MWWQERKLSARRAQHKLKNDSDICWLAWVDCLEGENSGENQPLLMLTRLHRNRAHVDGLKHLCSSRCSETQMDRRISEQRMNIEAHCQAA